MARGTSTGDPLAIHLLADGPQAPDWNMALDETLLRMRQEGEITGTWIRLFAWTPAAISIGRLQDPGADLDLALAAKDGVPVVRRSTGGKAVFHVDEVTYSLVGGVPDSEWGANLHETYRRVTAILVTGLDGLGVTTAFAPRRAASGGAASELEAACFAVAYGHELVAKGKKLCGSAQRRLTRAFLQHGSLLLGPAHAELGRYLSVPGDRPALARRLRDDAIDVPTAAGRPVSREELTQAILTGLEVRFGDRIVRDPLPARVRDQATARLAEVRVAGFPGVVDSHRAAI
jgi:lipoyl(octanoyl) transferase